MATTIKVALRKWEEASGKKAAEAKEIKLIGKTLLLMYKTIWKTKILDYFL